LTASIIQNSGHGHDGHQKPGKGTSEAGRVEKRPHGKKIEYRHHPY